MMIGTSVENVVLIAIHPAGQCGRCLLHRMHLCRCTSIQMSPGLAISFRQLKTLDLMHSWLTQTGIFDQSCTDPSGMHAFLTATTL